MLAIPILSTFVSLKFATPFMCITGLILSVTLIIKESKSLAWREAIYLVGGSLLGVPIGIYFLKNADELLAKLILGILLIFISSFRIFYKGNIEIKKDWVGIPFGFIGGILGGAFNVSGPAVVVYGTLKKWPPKKFIATIQAYFLPTNIMALTGFISAGVITSEIIKTVFFALPGLLLAIFIGHKFNKKIKPEIFQTYINYFILLIGSLLIITSTIKLIN